MVALKTDYEPLDGDITEHDRCQPEDPQHSCSCHLSPPCSNCVGCPSYDEEAWEEVSHV